MSRNPDSILYLSQRCPWPKDSGGNIRTFHLLEALARQYAVSLVTTEPDVEKEGGMAELSRFCETVDFVPDRKSHAPIALARTVLKSLVHNRPAFIEHNLNTDIATTTRRRLAGGCFDMIHLNQIDTFPYLDDGTGGDVPYVLDTHNLHHEYYARRATLETNPLKKALFSLETRKLRRYELHVFKRALRVLVCSENEKQTLLDLTPGLDVAVIPNGVDCAQFKPGQGDPFDNRPDLVFVGDMAYAPNHDGIMQFIEHVLPEVRRVEPRVRLIVVGKSPSQALVDMASARDDVSVTGYVDDVSRLVHQAKVFVVPLRYGAGTRLKVPQAFAFGIPTVSTSLGAEGIEYRDGHDILIADDAGAMVRAICALLSDRELYGKLHRHCRQTALDKYDWVRIGQRLMEVYVSL